MKGYQNKAENLSTGTIRVMAGKVINEGEEVLFAYHECYWRRWDAERPQRRRGRKRKHHDTDADDAA